MNSETTPSIMAVLQAGQFAQAEKLCRDELRLQPRHEQILIMLALSLQYQQRPNDALAIYAELVQHHPFSSVHWNNYATQLMEVRQRDRAIEAFRKAVELDANNAVPKAQLGLLLVERHEYLQARDMLLDAHALDPEAPWIRIRAARACIACQDFEGAIDLLRPWRRWIPLGDDPLQFELAQVLVLNNDMLGATALLEDLLSRQPGAPETRMLLASLYERINRLDAAEAMVRPILDRANRTGGEFRNEAEHMMATLAQRRGDHAKARELLEQCGPNGPEDDAHFFQLANACDKLGDADATMRALAEAHHVNARLRQYESPEFYAADAKAMPSEVPHVTAEQYQRWPTLIAPEAHDSPLFVVGFPRSGTTLLEQMLDAHPALQSMDENPFFNRLSLLLQKHDKRILDDLSVLRQFDCDELRKLYNTMVGERIQRRWDAQLVDKNPLNMQWLPMMHRLFPEAKYILAVRHPCDVLLSCYMQNFRSSILGAACMSLERLAHAYVQVMTEWLRDVETFKPNVMVSRYEDLVSDFSPQVSRLASFIGLEDASPMLAFDQHARNKGFIGTPSYSQVIEPVNRKGVGRWHKYRRQLEPVLPILEPMLKHWGYAVDE